MSTVATIEPPSPRAPVADALRRRTTLHWVLRRVAAGLITLLVVSLLVFAATQVLPGDAASALLGRQATGAQLAELRGEMGLDRPLAERYADWLAHFVRGDLGKSAAAYASGGKASLGSQVAGKLGNSLLLAGIVFAIVVPLSMVLGVIAATHARRPADHLLSVAMIVLLSLPEFVFGSVLILIFFTAFDLLPPVSLLAPGESPLAHPDILVLPVLTLVGVTVGAAGRMIRAGMLDSLRSDYVQMARLSGLPERQVIRRYALRNALAPSVQVLALILQYLIGGIVVVEYLFAYPGIGKELIDAVAVRDVFEVQALTMLLAAAYVAINIVADLIVVLLVPKLRTGAS
jgi:peptide/nickel transport system permease protein